MTDWNEKNDYMSLVLPEQSGDTASMDNSNLHQNTAASSFLVTAWHEAIGPEYQVATLSCAVAQQASPQSAPPTLRTCVAVLRRRPRSNWFRRVRTWVRDHPGYTSSPSQQTLDRIGHPRR